MRKISFSIVLLVLASAVCQAAVPNSPRNNAALKPLKKLKDKIVYESFRDGSWELMIMNADGTNQKNFTNTPGINESYPQCSPDGKLIAYECCDNTSGAAKRIEVMTADGTGRRKIIDGGRQMCWNADGTKLAYLPARRHGERGKGLFFYDMKTGQATSWTEGKEKFIQVELDGREHEQPISEFGGMANLTWSKDGKWIACSVGGLGYSQSMIAIEVGGDHVVDFIHQSLDVGNGYLGCRPCFSDDGTKVCWTVCDMNKLFWVDSASVDFSGKYPKAGKGTDWIRTEVPEEYYHADFSPDGRFIAFSWGVRGNRMKKARYVPGELAPGWNICIVDTQNPDQFTVLTRDGLSNKEPDWLKVE